MPLALNPLEHLVFLTLNQAPGPILDLYGGTAQRVVLAGIRLKVFEALAQESTTAQALARQLNLDVRGAEILLGTLAGLGYLKRDGEQFRLTALTRKWLTDAEGSNLAAYYLFWGAMQERLFPKLEESLRLGQPPENLYDWLETQPEVSRYFQEGLAAFARLYSTGVANSVPVPARPCRLLDVGGGHALYSIALCQKYPQLSAVILDGAQALAVGRQSIHAAQLDERVAVQEGDFATDPLGSGFDVALIFNILHGFGAEQNKALLGKVKAALNPGGRVVIMDQLVGKSGTPIAEAFTRILGIRFFHMVGGQTYTYDDIQGWLTQAGFGSIQLKRSLKVGVPLLFAESR
jgi:SAM-dependent methyltransferase